MTDGLPKSADPNPGSALQLNQRDLIDGLSWARLSPHDLVGDLPQPLSHHMGLWTDRLSERCPAAARQPCEHHHIGIEVRHLVYRHFCRQSMHPGKPVLLERHRKGLVRHESRHRHGRLRQRARRHYNRLRRHEDPPTLAD